MTQKHEIEVEGLPKGWKPVAFRRPLKGESFITSEGSLLKDCTPPHDPRLIVEKYSHSG